MVLRLIQYINEVSGQQYSPAQLSDDDTAAQLNKECSQIISEYKKEHGVLLRGIKGYNPKAHLVVKTMRGDRIPRDTEPHVHDWLNDEFEKRVGWKVRNGISTTSSWRTASGYGEGKVYIFFPKNGYKYCWSPDIQDLTLSLPSDIRNSRSRETLDYTMSQVGRPGKPSTAEMMRRSYFDTYRATDLTKGISSGNEIMFNVPKYFLLAVHSGETFRQVMGKVLDEKFINNPSLLSTWTRS